MKNKITRRYVLPRLALIGTYTTLVASIACGITIGNFKEPFPTENTKNNAPLTISLIGIAFVVCVIMFAKCSLQKDANDLLQNANLKYLETLLSHRDFRHLRKLIYDKRALRHIMGFISNNLTKAEQKQITDIIAQTQQSFDPIKSEEAYSRIETIIKNHAEKNPEFLDSLYVYMLDKKYTYIVDAKQSRRQK